MLQAREEFISPAPEETLQQVAQKLRGRNIEVLIVDDGDEARAAVLALCPRARKFIPASRRHSRTPASSTPSMMWPSTTRCGRA